MGDPSILLFDEPTSALDPEMVREIGIIISRGSLHHNGLLFLLPMRLDWPTLLVIVFYFLMGVKFLMIYWQTNF